MKPRSRARLRRLTVPIAALVLVLPAGAASPAGAADAEPRTWYLTNILAGQGSTLGPHLSMQEGTGNGTAVSGYILVQEGSSRIWISPATSPGPMGFGTDPWTLRLGGTSATARIRWVVGTWDWNSQTFSPLPGPEAVAQGLQASTFVPAEPFTLPPTLRVALRIVGDGGGALIDVHDRTGGDSPSTLTVAGDPPTTGPTDTAQRRVGKLRCDHRDIPTNPECPEAWLTRHGALAEMTFANDAAISPDGRTLFVTGGVHDRRFNLDWMTVAFDAATGEPRWESRVDGPGGSEDRATKIAVDPEGRYVFVTGSLCKGRTTTQSCNLDLATGTVAYDAQTGAELWRSQYQPATQTVPRAMAVSPDGETVAVTAGTTAGGVGGFDVATVAYDAATGAQRWAARYGGPDGLEDRPDAMAFSPNGGAVYVAGWTRGAENFFDYLLLAYDTATGAEQVLLTYDRAGGSDQAAGLAAVGGTVYVTGSATDDAGRSDVVTLAYDPERRVLRWTHVHDGPWGGDDVAVRMAVPADGSKVVVAAREFEGTTSSSSVDVGVFAVDAATGESLWATSWSGPGKNPDHARDLAIGADGRTVAVVAESGRFEVTTRDIATLALDAETGRIILQARYDGPGGGWDPPAAAEVSPDRETVYATGSVQTYGADAGNASARQMVAIAYRLTEM